MFLLIFLLIFALNVIKRSLLIIYWSLRPFVQYQAVSKNTCTISSCLWEHLISIKLLLQTRNLLYIKQCCKHLIGIKQSLKTPDWY